MRLDNWTESLLLLEKIWQPFEDCIFEGDARMINVFGKVVGGIFIVVVVFSL